MSMIDLLSSIQLSNLVLKRDIYKTQYWTDGKHHPKLLEFPWNFRKIRNFWKIWNFHGISGKSEISVEFLENPEFPWNFRIIRNFQKFWKFQIPGNKWLRNSTKLPRQPLKFVDISGKGNFRGSPNPLFFYNETSRRFRPVLYVVSSVSQAGVRRYVSVRFDSEFPST